MAGVIGVSDEKHLRWPGIEPGSTAWKAAMLTTIPPTPVKSLETQSETLQSFLASFSSLLWSYCVLKCLVQSETLFPAAAGSTFPQTGSFKPTVHHLSSTKQQTDTVRD